MFDHAALCTLIARLRARRHPAAARRANPIGDTMSTTLATRQSAAPSRSRRTLRRRDGLASCYIMLAFVPLVSFTTTAARACACGCSVFDVGGLDLPQEQDHGGRIFLEYWSGDQTQNYVGSSKAPAALNTDKEINTQWINVGFSYNFNRDWGVMVRIPRPTAL